MPNRGNNSTSILTKQKIEPWQGKLYNRKNLKKGLIIRQIMIVEYFKHNKATPLTYVSRVFKVSELCMLLKSFGIKITLMESCKSIFIICFES